MADEAHAAGEPSGEAGSPGKWWTALAVLGSAAFALAFILLPARGLTFTGDDWLNFPELDGRPWPARWLRPMLEHWEPGYLLWLDLQRQAFGNDHHAYLVVSFLVHALNVWLLARYLTLSTGDARAGALVALAFGVAISYREALLVASQGGLAPCFSLAALSLLAFEHFRKDGGRLWLGVSVAAAILAPLFWAVAIPLSFILGVEAWVLLERPRAARVAAVYAAGFALYWLAYFTMSGALGEVRHSLPEKPSHFEAAALYFCEQIGLGVVRNTTLLPVPETTAWGVALAIVAAVGVAAAARLVPAERRRVLLSAFALAALLGPIALARWRLQASVQVGLGLPPIMPAPAAWSHYFYVPGLAWTAGVAHLLAAALRARPRRAVSASAVAIPLLALLHAIDAGSDRRWFSPLARRHNPELLRRIDEAALAAKGPVYDTALRRSLAWPGTRASHVLRILDPRTEGVAWTTTRSEASLAPFRSDPALRLLAGLPLEGGEDEGR